MNQIKDERKPLSGKGGERFTREGIPGFSIEFMPKSWLFLSDKFFVPKSSMRYFLSCLRSESFLKNMYVVEALIFSLDDGFLKKYYGNT